MRLPQKALLTIAPSVVSGQESPRSPSWPIHRAAYARRASFQNMRIHHGRFYVAMAEMLLDRADIVVSSSGFAAEEWQLRVMSGRLGGVGMARRLLYM